MSSSTPPTKTDDAVALIEIARNKISRRYRGPDGYDYVRVEDAVEVDRLLREAQMLLVGIEPYASGRFPAMEASSAEILESMAPSEQSVVKKLKELMKGNDEP